MKDKNLTILFALEKINKMTSTAGFEPARVTPWDFKSHALTTRPNRLYYHTVYNLNPVINTMPPIYANMRKTWIFWGEKSKCIKQITHKNYVLRIMKNYTVFINYMRFNL